ncbi:MAG TPA: class I SAM-dependent methyltransferase [Candidatus Limnocylindrales bacterium]|nr:class I SAM-dependent methyltransferase [Candidatus Limnocylindrales bacterium]
MSEYTSPPVREPSLLGIHLGLIKDLPDAIRGGLTDRVNMLETFADDPANASIWLAVIDKTLQEEGLNLGQPEELRDVPAAELADYAIQMLQTDPSDRYQLTTSYASNGNRWFDILYGFHSPSADAAIEGALKLHPQPEGVAVDLGCGTGKTTAKVASYADATIGIDMSPDLLTVAQVEQEANTFMQADVTELPFSDNSINVITSSGLRGALDANQALRMYSEVARVLQTGGRYIDSDWRLPKDIVLSVGGFGKVEHPDAHPEYLKSFVTWRAVLQDMIVDMTSGKFEKADSLDESGYQWQEYLWGLGMYETRGNLISDFDSRCAVARILHKDPTRAEKERRQAHQYIRSMRD